MSPFLFKLFKDAYKEAEDTGSGFSSEISTSFVTADLNFFKMELILIDCFSLYGNVNAPFTVISSLMVNMACLSWLV